MKNFFEQFLEETSIIAITNKIGDIIYVNDNFCEISGYSREELLTKNHRIVKSGYHDNKLYLDLWKTISSGKPWRGEICNRAKNGNLYWVDTFIKPELDKQGRPIRYYSYRILITEKKEEQKKISTLINMLPDIIIMKDAQSRWVLANEAAKLAFGFTLKEEWFGKSELELSHSRVENSKIHEASIITDEIAWMNRELTESYYTAPNEKEFNVRKIPLFNADGTRKALVVVATDISKLTAFSKRLATQNELLRQIADIQSHEIRGPVATLLGLANLFHAQPTTKANTKEIIHAVEQTAKALDKVIHKIVDKTYHIEDYSELMNESTLK